jgi:TIGR03009 family protein
MTIRAGFVSALVSATVWTALVLGVAAETLAQSTEAAGGTKTAPANAPADNAAAQAQPLPAPFTLTPAEQANLDQLLKDWEAASNSIKTFKCGFTRMEYDPALVGGNPNQPSAVSKGELKYATPDKGMFRVKEQTNFAPNPAAPGKFAAQPVDPSEWWTCDGKSMYEVTIRNNDKLVVETPLPPELQGKAITDGPLPFVFGAKAAALKDRYYMRVITPAQKAAAEVWLEAFPRQQKDAANFSSVTLILEKTKLQPMAVQIFNPGANAQNPSRTVILLEDASVNSPWAPLQNLFDDFARPNPIGYKHVLQQNLVPPPTTAKSPEGKSDDNSQASKTKATAK